MVKLGLLVLGAAALVSASPVSNDEADGFPFIMTDAEASSSKGFHLVSVPKDEHHPLASTVKGLFLNGYHYGAGLNMPVFHGIDAHNPGSVFYVNQKPGSPEVILTDAGPFPYSFNVPAATEKKVQAVMLPVGDVGTPVAISSAGTKNRNHVTNGLDASGRGTFLACKHQVPYYRNTEMVVLQYAYDGSAPAGCVPIRLELQCAELPAPQPNSRVSHQYAKTVTCHRKVIA